MATRIPVESDLLEWAIERSGRDPAELHRRFAGLASWLAGHGAPTLRQLEAFARATYTPLGFLLLERPPVDALPIADFRGGREPALRPSANLLETIALCEQRQDWFQHYARANQHDRLDFVGSLQPTTDPELAAAAIRTTLDFAIANRRAYATWTDALAGLIERAESVGVLVMVSGVVGSNTHRRLDRDEFRGFALVDELAPVVFINSADTKASQIFTLAHELAHVWLGSSGVSNPQLDHVADGAVETWCNAVAAELLVPIADLAQQWRPASDLDEQTQRLARRYRVSTLVILRRARDAGFLTAATFRTAYDAELERILAASRAGGGDFYRTQPVRLSKTFTRSVVLDTLEGNTLRRDAFRLLGFSKAETFDRLARKVGAGA